LSGGFYQKPDEKDKGYDYFDMGKYEEVYVDRNDGEFDEDDLSVGIKRDVA